jgi:hypothetical protein
VSSCTSDDDTPAQPAGASGQKKLRAAYSDIGPGSGSSWEARGSRPRSSTATCSASR